MFRRSKVRVLLVALAMLLLAMAALPPAHATWAVVLTDSQTGEVGIGQIPTQVRFHGPADLMFEAVGVEPPEIAVARSMEASSFRMADRVVVPSPGIGTLATERYDLDRDRITVGPPPLGEVRS